jgi:hypothetical protein
VSGESTGRVTSVRFAGMLRARAPCYPVRDMLRGGRRAPASLDDHWMVQITQGIPVQFNVMGPSDLNRVHMIRS